MKKIIHFNALFLYRTIRWLLVVLLIGAPFVYSRFTFEFLGTAKEMFIIIGLTLVILVIFLHYLYTIKLRLPRSPLNYFILGLLLYSGAIYLFSPHKNIAFWGEANAFASFYHFLIYGLIYFLCLKFLRINLNKDHLAVFAVISLLIGFIDLILVFNFVNVFVAPGFFIGSYNNFLFFVGLIFSIFTLLYIFYFNSRSKIVNFITSVLWLISFALLLLASFYNIFMWFALFVVFSLAFIINLFFVENKKYQLRAFSFFILTVLSLLVVLTPVSLKSTISVQVNKLIKSPPIEIGLAQRYSYDLALKSIKTNPVFGQGFGQFPFYYELKKEPAVYSTDFGNITFSQSANLLSQLLIEAGLIFVLIFYGVLFLAFFYAFKKVIMSDGGAIQDGSIFLAMAVIVYLIFSSFFANYTFSYGILLFAVLGIIGSTVAKTGIIEIEFSERYKKILTNLAILIFVFTFVFLFVFETRRFGSSWYLRKAVLEQDLERRLDYLGMAYFLVDSNDLLAREISLVYLNLALERIKKLSENTTPKEKEDINNIEVFGYLQNTISYAKRAIQLNPSNYLNYQFAGFIYESIIGYADGSFYEALKHYNDALNFSTNNPEINYSIARSYYKEILSRVRNIEKDESLRFLINSYISRGEAFLKKALQIKPFFVQAYNLLGDFSVLGNQLDKAIQSYSNSALLNPNPQIYYQLGLLYWQKQDLAKAKENLLRSIGLLPNYSDARYILALIYNQEGNLQEALKHLEIIAKYNADNEMVNSMIEDIKKKLGI